MTLSQIVSYSQVGKGAKAIPKKASDEFFPINPANIPKSKQVQQEEYTSMTYGFPAKPRDKWIASLKGGVNFFHGDVLNKTSWNLGLDVGKAIGHAVSLRVSGVIGKLTGQNKETNSVLAGSIDQLLGYGGVTVWNFETSYQYLAFHMLFNLNNINFYDDEPKLRFYAFIGPAFMWYQVRSNLQDDNGLKYDYNQWPDVNLDNSYETNMDKDTSKNSLVQPVPIFNLGFGLSYKISKRFEAGMEFSYHSEMLRKNDLWDGRRFQETANVLSTDYDGFTSVRVFVWYNFGKGVEPLMWANPLEIEYEEVRELKKKISEMMVDSDDDGVADPFDKEADTPKGAKVGPDGTTLDSDQDGIADYLDSEPYSQFTAVVDSTGNTPVNAENVPRYLSDYIDKKIKDCCEKDHSYRGNNGLPEIREATKDPGKQEKGKIWNNVLLPTNKVNTTGLWALPVIHFDLDKDEIKPEMFDEMLFVATVLKNNPSIKVSVNGHTDIRATDAYNENLGLRRAQHAREHLIKYFNIAPERLEINTYGERRNMIADAEVEIEHYMNRRVEFYAIYSD